MIDFNILWRYFAWVNQTLAMFTLWAITVYLARHNKFYIISLIPAIFMTMVCVSYFIFAPSPEGFGASITVALSCATAVVCVILFMFIRYLKLLRSGRLVHEVGY